MGNCWRRWWWSGCGRFFSHEFCMLKLFYTSIMMSFFFLPERRKSPSKSWAFCWHVCSVFVYFGCLFCCIVRKTILILFWNHLKIIFHQCLYFIFGGISLVVIVAAALVQYPVGLFILLFMPFCTLFWCISNLVEF
jgi:hypothetical protein